MSSEKSPPTEFEELRHELLQSESRATRNRRAFWIIGGIWLLALALLFLLNAQTLRRQEITEARIADTEARLREAQNALQVVESRHNAQIDFLEMRYEALWNSQFNELSEKSQRNYRNQLAMDVLGRRERTETEKKALTLTSGEHDITPHRDMLFAEAVSAIDLKEPERAIARLDEYDEQGGSDALSLLARGRALDLKHEMAPAIEMYTRALELDDLTDSDRVAAYGYRCLSRLRLAAQEGQDPQALEDAEEDCDRSLGLDSGYWPSYNYRGLIRFLQGKDVEALSDWEEAADLLIDPREKANPTENQSLVYLRQGSWQEALETTMKVEALAGDGKDRSWNWLFQWIAADKLGNAALAKLAMEKWEEDRDTHDREKLLIYLPEELHSYLGSASKPG